MPRGRKRHSKHANKANTKGTANPAQTSSARAPDPTPLQCLTLGQYPLFTRCGQLATEGDPKPERCLVHHGQFLILCKKYKEASEVVDAIKDGGELPTNAQIRQYKDWFAVLADKVRLVRKYLEAMREEKTGREIHLKRFFLQANDSHRRRMELLTREMARAVNMLDALQERAYELYYSGTVTGITSRKPCKAEVEFEKQSKRTAEELLEIVRNMDACIQFFQQISPLLAPTGSGDEDLIDMSLRDLKEKMILAMKPLIDIESAFLTPRAEADYDEPIFPLFVRQQFVRRIIFHHPNLFWMSTQRVSFKNLILSDEFSMEDFARVLNLYSTPLGFPLKWFKDAVLDALALSRDETVGKGNWFPVLGSSVFNHSHATMPNDAWFVLLNILQPPPDVESNFVRLCNNFDDLVSFLSFAALGLVPRPSFCKSPPLFDPDDPGLSRDHLSLLGVVVADMVGIPVHPPFQGPLPTMERARQYGSVVWAEMEVRAYMFGAVRCEEDAFVDAFLNELRARPDLFQVVLRRDGAPGHEVETFGSGPANDNALPVIRQRQFESPPSAKPPTPPPSAHWEVTWSAKEVLYGTNGEWEGYLARGNTLGDFFHFKTFPVTYFVIVDTVPYRNPSVLARNVAWAALRAGGYAWGRYTLRKYAVAADELVGKCTRERMEWLPGWSGEALRMQDKLGSSWSCNIL